MRLGNAPTNTFYEVIPVDAFPCGCKSQPRHVYVSWLLAVLPNMCMDVNGAGGPGDHRSVTLSCTYRSTHPSAGFHFLSTVQKKLTIHFCCRTGSPD